MKGIYEVKEIIDSIAATSSRNEKESILHNNRDNRLLKNILYFVYSPYVLTGLSKKKINKKVKLPEELSPLSIVDIMEYLKVHNSGRDGDIVVVQHFIKSQPENLQEFYTKIVTKDLIIGATAGTINKAFGEQFIEEFDVMLAEKYFDQEDKVKGNFIITEKLDGNRNIALNGETVEMRTRQGQLNEGFLDVEEELRLLPKGYAYDGEFIAVNENNLNSADLYRVTTSIARKDGMKKNIIFHVFDMLPIEDFKKGICHIPCIQRKNALHEFINELDLKWIQEVPILYKGSDKEQVTYWLDKLTSEGSEGCMVNLADAPYECKRSKQILKVKKMQSVDLKIVGFEEGDGRLKGTLGRINVMYKGTLVGVGSGYSDSERTYIWKNRNDLIGSIIEVKYFEESTNKKTNEISLRFPIFKGIRDDKTEESYY